MTIPSWIRPALAVLLLILPGCSLVQEFFSLINPQIAPVSRMRESVIARIRPAVQASFDAETADVHAQIVSTHASVETLPGRFMRRAAVQSLKQPWDGLASIEVTGLLVAELAEGGSLNLAAILDVLEAGMDRTSEFHQPVPFPTTFAPDDHIEFMTATLEQAARHRDTAFADLTDAERQFLFRHGQALAEHYTPQISLFTEQTVAQIKATGRFAELLEERVNYAALIADAQALARLANGRWLRQLAEAFPKALPAGQNPPGITGEVMLAQRTSEGLIVIGGPGPNTYELDQRVALVIDLGGDDLYRGSIGASGDEQHGNAVVIDLAGNDTYEGAPMGLATGRLGVGLVIDRAGDDVYQLHQGSGGAGFAGLGMLVDMQGNDVYMGDRLTQGAAIGGLGLLLDLAGNDRYTSHGFALGFGGPLGVGAVVDVAGDDRYQCGGFIPSAYNAQDAPQAKPGDPLFQYDCFGLGVGSGLRVLAKQPERQAQSLAGGWGLLIDLDGADQYQSANFSQGTGYFFGTGTLLDLDGDDDYQAARYGQGASAHYGVALFIDRHGDDRYHSSGPFYNAGVAWDHGVSLTIDAGTGKDRYAIDQSTGLGKADYTGWAIFVDEGGADAYAVKLGFGEASEKSLAGFVDLGGNDTYALLAPASGFRPANGTTVPRPPGGFFSDR